MLITISPAKLLNFDDEVSLSHFSTPGFLSEADELMQTLKSFSVEELADLMNVNYDIAQLNYQRFLQWQPITNQKKNSRQAIFAYFGEVFKGIDARSFSNKDLVFVQNHLRIISGLYGVLRPLDLIKPYRLEIVTPLKTNKADNLYEFWGEKINRAIETVLEQNNSKTIINLASDAYFKTLKPFSKGIDVITPVFKETKNGKQKVIVIYTKKARGLMTRFIIKNRLKAPEDLKAFNEDGYAFDQALSTKYKWVFVR